MDTNQPQPENEQNSAQEEKQSQGEVENITASASRLTPRFANESAKALLDSTLPAKTDQEKARNWNVSVILGLLLALIAAIAGIIALLPESEQAKVMYSIGLIGPTPTPTPTFTPTNTATMTPTFTPTATHTLTPTNTHTFTPTPDIIAATEGEILIILATFKPIGGGTPRQVEELLQLRIEEGVEEPLKEALERVQELDINVRLDITSQIVEEPEEAREIAENFGAVLVIYGIIEEAGMNVSYETVENAEQHVLTKPEERRYKALAKQDLDTLLSDPRNEISMVQFVIAQVLYSDGQYQAAMPFLNYAIKQMDEADEERYRGAAHEYLENSIAATYSQRNENKNMSSY